MEDLVIQCPCCSSTLSFDDAGDVVVITEGSLLPGHFHNGTRSLVVEDADGGAFRQKDYLRNQQANAVPNRLAPPSSLTKPDSAVAIEEEESDADTINPIEPDPSLIAAVHKDLNDKGIY